MIDLGPEAGDGGGTIIYAGVPEGLKKIKGSYTAIICSRRNVQSARAHGGHGIMVDTISKVFMDANKRPEPL